jgi:hypothetical protein
MSIAVVGFSMVVGILRDRSLDDRMRLFTLRDVADMGLIGAVMSAFPLVVYGFATSAETTWRLSSAVLGAWQFASIANSIRKRGSVSIVARQFWFTASRAACLVVVSFALILVNVAAPSSLSGARYVAYMMILLTQAGFMFVFAAFDIGRAKIAS